MINFFRRLFGLGEIVRSVKSGYWTDGDTWDVGHVPQDKAKVIISSGHTVEFNGDMKGFSTGINLLVQGTLYQTREAGHYCIKTKDGIIVHGRLDLGTEDNRIPNTVTIDIYGNITCKTGSFTTIFGTPVIYGNLTCKIGKTL